MTILRFHRAVVMALIDARSQTDHVEEGAIAFLHQRGHYAGLNEDECQELDALVRKLVNNEISDGTEPDDQELSEIQDAPQ